MGKGSGKKQSKTGPGQAEIESYLPQGQASPVSVTSLVYALSL